MNVRLVLDECATFVGWMCWMNVQLCWFLLSRERIPRKDTYCPFLFWKLYPFLLSFFHSFILFVFRWCFLSIYVLWGTVHFWDSKAPPPIHTHISVCVDMEVVDSGEINEQEYQVERMKLLGKTAPEGGVPAASGEEEKTRDGYVPPHLRNRDGGGAQEEEKQQVQRGQAREYMCTCEYVCVYRCVWRTTERLCCAVCFHTHRALCSQFWSVWAMV